MTLENPPKFVDCAPKTVAEWKLFFHWLTNLWRVAKDSVNVSESIALNNTPQASMGSAQEQALGSALAFKNAARPEQNIDLFATIKALNSTQPKAVCGLDAEKISSFKALNGTQPKIAASLDAAEASALLRWSMPQSKLYAISDTHANRIKYGPDISGMIYKESDTGVYYLAFDSAWHYILGVINNLPYSSRPDPTILSIGEDGLLFKDSTFGIIWRFVYDPITPKWIYQSGIFSSILANIPAVFILADAGALFESTDYKHVHRWTGTAWEFAPSDNGSGFVVIGNPNGSAPNGGLWAACDGSAVNVAQPNGTIASVTTQNLQGDVVIKGSAASAAQQSAVAPTGTLTKFTTNSSGTNALTAINPPSEANGGLPLRISVVFYIRR